MHHCLKLLAGLALTLGLLAPAGCKSNNSDSNNGSGRSSNQGKPATRPASAKAIRIDAGSATATTDAAGNIWQPDTGFSGGGMVDRGNIAIANTKSPAIYRTEHWGMNSFSMPVPNGRYNVALHFAETYPPITAAGQRIFTIKVEDQQIKDLDVFKEAGGANKALVKTLPVTVTDSKLDITFTFGEQNPEINGIEIIPQ